MFRLIDMSRTSALIPLLLACSGVQAPAFGQAAARQEAPPPVPPVRPQMSDPQIPTGVPAQIFHTADPGCLARLADLGVELDSKRTIPAPDNQACTIAAPVVLVSVRNPADPAKFVFFPDRPLLACAMAEKLAHYTFEMLNPLARDALGAEIASIGTGPGYECRPRNRQPGAIISTHGQGLAFDIMHVAFNDKQQLDIASPKGPGQEVFLKKLLETACTTFNTVLGPAADSFHRDNVHIDIQPRGRDGNVKFCR